MVGAYFSISSLIYILVLIFFFFSKQKVNNIETRVYKYFLITMFIGLFFDVLGFIVFRLGCDPYTLLYKSIAKIMLLYFVAWSFEFLYYIYAISYKNKETNKIDFVHNVLVAIFAVLSIILIILPIKFNVVDNVIFPDGLSVSLTYGIFAISILLATLISLKNSQKIIRKKYTPLYLLLLLTVAIFVIQKAFPQLFLVNFSLSLVVIIMYFTIENPDLKMLQSYHDAKQYAEDLNIEKQMFIYNISQDMKLPLIRTSKYCEDLLYKEDLSAYKNGIRKIKSECNSMIQKINSIYGIDIDDVSKIDTDNIKYNLHNLLKLISSGMQKEVELSHKKIQFVSSIDETLPKELLGDSTRIKEVLNNLFELALKNTTEGYIELKVQGLTKGNICRLMVSLEDSSQGIEASALEELLSKDSNDNVLKSSKKIVSILGGNLIVTSNVGVGTKVNIILDQQIVTDSTKEIDKYENEYFDKKNILVLGATDEERKLFMRDIDEFGGIMETLDSLNDVIKNINKHKKYYAIVIDGDTKYYDVKQAIEKLKGIKGFNSKIIVLSKSKEMKSTKTRALLGISGYLARPISEGQLLDILKI